jgi:hypothetical protein
MKQTTFDYIPNRNVESIYRQHLTMMIHGSNIHTQIYNITDGLILSSSIVPKSHFNKTDRDEYNLR